MSWGPSSAAQYRWSRTGLGRSAAQSSSVSAGIDRITRGAALHDICGESRRGCADVEYGAGGDVKQRLLTGECCHPPRGQTSNTGACTFGGIFDWVYVYEATAVAGAMCAHVQDRRGGGILVRRDRCSPDVRYAALEMGSGNVPRSCSLVRRDSTCPSRPDGGGDYMRRDRSFLSGCLYRQAAWIRRCGCGWDFRMGSVSHRLRRCNHRTRDDLRCALSRVGLQDVGGPVPWRVWPDSG
jgi:hypothetical protein